MRLAASAAVVLAIVALAGIHQDVLAPIAVIVFGAALLIQGGAIIAFGAAAVISSNSVRQLYLLRSAATRIVAPQGGSTLLAGEMASGSAGVQLLAGLTAIVLGILAVTGTNPAVLILSALIVLGAAIVLSGSTLSGIVMGFMPTTEATARARVLP